MDNGAKSQCSNSVSVTVLKVYTRDKRLHLHLESFFTEILKLYYTILKVLAKAVEDDKFLDCINIKPCSSAVYSLVNPSRTSFPPAVDGSTVPEGAITVIQFENTMVCMKFFHQFSS